MTDYEVIRATWAAIGSLSDDEYERVADDLYRLTGEAFERHMLDVEREATATDYSGNVGHTVELADHDEALERRRLLREHLRRFAADEGSH